MRSLRPQLNLFHADLTTEGAVKSDPINKLGTEFLPLLGGRSPVHKCLKNCCGLGLRPGTTVWSVQGHPTAHRGHGEEQELVFRPSGDDIRQVQEEC